MSDRHASPPVESEPRSLTLSVVICTRDRPGRLSACVDSVTEQSRRPDEIIVVDDGELTSNKRELLQRLCRAAGIEFVYLRKEEPGLTKSRNLGVRHARGDVVQFLDDDVTLEPGFLAEVMRVYEADVLGAIAGGDGTLTEPNAQPSGHAAFEMLYRLAGWWRLAPRVGQRRPLPAVMDGDRVRSMLRIVGATMAFRRAALLTRAFDEEMTGYALGEDRDMAWRLAQEGWIVRLRDARANHHHDPASRPDAATLGEMTVRNYVRVMTRAGLTGIGDRLVIGYNFGVIATGLLIASLKNPGRYLRELRGMVKGAVKLIHPWGRKSPVDIPGRKASRPATS